MGWRRGQAYGQDLGDRVRVAEGTLAAATGPGQCRVQCNHVPLRLQGLEGALAERVVTAPEQTLAQLCQWVEAEHDVRVGLATMWKALRRLGLTLKKSHSRPPSSNVPM